MMKKTYQIPETYIFNELIVGSPLATSDPLDLEEGRITEGDITNNGIPQQIGNTSDEDEDPYSNGQDGNSNRAKMWDDAWDLPKWWNF